MRVFLRCLAKASVLHLAVPVHVATDKACSATTHIKFCICENSLQQYCLLFSYNICDVYDEFTSGIVYWPINTTARLFKSFTYSLIDSRTFNT